MTNDVKFFDSRQRYLLFVTTTNEKAVISEKLCHLIDELKPSKPDKIKNTAKIKPVVQVGRSGLVQVLKLNSV